MSIYRIKYFQARPERQRATEARSPGRRLIFELQPSGGSSSASSGDYFNDGSACASPPHCRRTGNCKPPDRILAKAVELPVAKCQLERLAQIGVDPFGEPQFVRKRDCDRVLIQ